MKFGILGAMPQEVDLIKSLMTGCKESVRAGRTYYEGHIGEHEVVLTFSRWGKVAASSTTTTLINSYHVEFILFTGVAGAVHSDLNIGDIVVGNGFYQHDMDARPFYDQFQVPSTESIVFESKSDDVVKASAAAEAFVSHIDSYIPTVFLNKYSLFRPTVHVGLIASGDKFIADPAAHDDLKYRKGDGSTTLAVEMEGAAVAQVCVEHDIPFVVVRTISDKADHSATIDFAIFVDEVASHYSAAIIKEYLNLTR